jgi:hypothetical protein
LLIALSYYLAQPMMLAWFTKTLQLPLTKKWKLTAAANGERTMKVA